LDLQGYKCGEITTVSIWWLYPETASGMLTDKPRSSAKSLLIMQSLIALVSIWAIHLGKYLPKEFQKYSKLKF